MAVLSAYIAAKDVLAALHYQQDGVHQALKVGVSYGWQSI